MLKRKTSVGEYQQSIDQDVFLDQLPTNKQIRSYLVQHYSPKKNKSKTSSSNDLNSELTIDDIIQYKIREKYKNIAQNQSNQIEYNHNLDILNSQKCSKKISDKYLLLPKIIDNSKSKNNNNNNNLQAYSNEDNYLIMKKRQQRALSFSEKQDDKQNIRLNSYNKDKSNQSLEHTPYNSISSSRNNHHSSSKSINLSIKSPLRQRRILNEEEYEQELQRQSRLITRKLELDEQLAQQADIFKKKIEHERSLDKLQIEVYEKENEENEERKIKLKKLKKSTQSVIKQQIVEKLLKNKEYFEQLKNSNQQDSQNKKEEERISNKQLIEKKQALQIHYKELAKQIQNKQVIIRDSKLNHQKESESFQDKIGKQDELRIKNRQESQKKVQGFIKGQQREHKKLIFMEYKNMYGFT